MTSKKRSRNKKRPTAGRKGAAPQKRLKVSFDVLGAVAGAGDEVLQNATIENRPANRVQAGMFVRGINALKSTRVLAEQSQWEFAAGR